MGWNTSNLRLTYNAKFTNVIFGSHITECTEKIVRRSKCNKTIYRDENAVLDIVKAGVRFAPKGLLNEAVTK